MAKLIKLLDLVPSWAWAAAVATLLVLCIRLDVSRAHALASAATAGRELLSVQLASRQAILDELAKSRAKEGPLIAKVQEANDAVSQARIDLGSLVAAADDRLRRLSRPVALCPRRTDTGAGAGAAGGAPGGEPVPAGLRPVDGGDLLVIDGQARSELARHSATANLARQALSECLATLQAAHVATRPDAAAAGP